MIARACDWFDALPIADAHAVCLAVLAVLVLADLVEGRRERSR